MTTQSCGNRDNALYSNNSSNLNSGNCYPLNEDKQALSCGNSGTYNCGNNSKCNIILYCNIDVFTKSKQNLLDVRISDKLQDIICLTEVLPKHCYTLPKTESYQIKDYNMSAYNFNKRGICIYSKPHISVTVLDYI